MGLHWNSIIFVIVYPLLLPLYVFGTIKWYQWRQHSLFRYRYSLDSAVIILISYIYLHILIINAILSDLNMISLSTDRLFAHIMHTLWWIIWSMNYYRANLIFITCKIYQLQFNDLQQGGDISSSNTVSPRKHCSSQFLLGFTFIGALIYFFMLQRIQGGLGLLWSLVNDLLGIIIIITIKCKGVRELIGCLKECYIVFCVVIVFTIVLVFTGGPGGDVDAVRFIGFLGANVLALFILYYSLYVIYKYDRAQNVNDKSSDESVMTDIVSTSSNIANKCSDNATTVTAAKNKSFVDFLANKQDYDVFVHFLSLCFCLENMLFIQKVCIFRWKLMELIKDKSDIKENTHVGEIYSVKFTFLESIYTEYDNIVNNEQIDNEQQKLNAIWSICSSIYNEFVQDEAINQVNIPYNVKRKLDRLFETNDNVNKFKSYDQFVAIFDKSVFEIWVLLSGMYRFKFVDYLQKYQ